MSKDERTVNRFLRSKGWPVTPQTTARFVEALNTKRKNPELFDHAARVVQKDGIRARNGKVFRPPERRP